MRGRACGNNTRAAEQLVAPPAGRIEVGLSGGHQNKFRNLKGSFKIFRVARAVARNERESRRQPKRRMRERNPARQGEETGNGYSHRSSATQPRRLSRAIVALSSTSFAATTKLLPRNSVGTRQVINGSLQRVDLSTRAVKALRGRRGPVGPVGRQGPAGSFTNGNVSMVTGSIADLCPAQSGTCRFGGSSATCPPGKVAIAGGWHEVVGPADIDTSVTSNAPFHITGGVDGWAIGMRNNSDMPWSFYAIAICTG